eukprot:SAG31_NODE_25043_length_469_cov_0.829730_1_plen_40_part_10
MQLFDTDTMAAGPLDVTPEMEAMMKKMNVACIKVNFTVVI